MVHRQGMTHGLVNHFATISPTIGSRSNRFSPTGRRQADLTEDEGKLIPSPFHQFLFPVSFPFLGLCRTMAKRMASPSQESAQSSATLSTLETTVILEKSRRGKYHHLVGYAALRNNLLAGVGYLELANAGDFAANVWNDVPVPRHAVILMAIGGPIALLVSLIAARDFYLSWQNVSLLCSERKLLQSKTSLSQKIAAVFGVNFRELGTELIDRMLMDVLLGVGAVLVGTGTIMAIWGANPRVYEASNLMSGFVGNGFAAFFGIVNAGWSGYLVYRFQLRYAACVADPEVGTIRMKLRQRFRQLQWHAVINGLNCIVAGMASMVTARMWWGYVVLIPCVVVMIAGNLFWKWKLGYDRPVKLELLDDILRGEKTMAGDDGLGNILDSLACAQEARDALLQIAKTESLDTLLNFILQHQMLEGLCMHIGKAWSDHRLFNAPLVRMGYHNLATGSEEERTRMASECRRFLNGPGIIVLHHRERYLLELVGEVVWKGKLIDV